jgi:hypothetical protein
LWSVGASLLPVLVLLKLATGHKTYCSSIITSVISRAVQGVLLYSYSPVARMQPTKDVVQPLRRTLESSQSGLSPHSKVYQCLQKSWFTCKINV